MNPDTATALAREYMDRHGLVDWTFRLDSAKSRFGGCHWRSRSITLSRALVELNSEAKVTDTILHEIAHALAGQTKEHHGEHWKAMARQVGCEPVRCYGTDVVQPSRDWMATCPKCGKTVHRHTKPPKTKAFMHAACVDRYGPGPDLWLKFELVVDLADEDELKRIKANEASRRSKAKRRGTYIV